MLVHPARAPHQVLKNRKRRKEGGGEEKVEEIKEVRPKKESVKVRKVSQIEHENTVLELRQSECEESRSREACLHSGYCVFTRNPTAYYKAIILPAPNLQQSRAWTVNLRQERDKVQTLRVVTVG